MDFKDIESMRRISTEIEDRFVTWYSEKIQNPDLDRVKNLIKFLRSLNLDEPTLIQVASAFFDRYLVFVSPSSFHSSYPNTTEGFEKAKNAVVGLEKWSYPAHVLDIFSNEVVVKSFRNNKI